MNGPLGIIQMKADDEFFGLNLSKWKTHKFYICKTGSMTLWTALELMRCMECLYGPCKNRRKEYKEAVLSYPYKVDKSCKCKDCRYYRMSKRFDK